MTLVPTAPRINNGINIGLASKAKIIFLPPRSDCTFPLTLVFILILFFSQGRISLLDFTLRTHLIIDSIVFNV
jgi:hypothetical protein